MLVQKETENRLRELGLNSYESKLWIALLSRGVATASELSDIANVPRSRTYDVLEILEKKGFIMMKIGKPIKYVAVNPEHVIERVKKKVAEEAESKTSLLNKIGKSELLDELTSLHNSGIEKIDPLDYSGTIKGRKNLYHHLDFAIRDAKESIILSTTKEGIKRKSEALESALIFAKKKGTKIRIVAPFNNIPKEYSKKFSKFGEIKHTDEKGRFCVVDGKQFIVMLSDDEGINPIYDSGIWVNTPFFVNSFMRSFELTWSNLETIK